MGAYKDFIPEGEDPGALGHGFSDFVPAKEPKKEEEKPVEKPELPKKPIQSPFTKPTK